MLLVIKSKCYGVTVYQYTFMVSCDFTKGNNSSDSLFAYLQDEFLQKWGLFLKEMVAARELFFSLQS